MYPIELTEKTPKLFLNMAELDIGPIRKVGWLKLPMVRISWGYYYDYVTNEMVHVFFMRKLIKNRNGHYFEVVMGTNTEKYNELTGNEDSPHTHYFRTLGYENTPLDYQKYLNTNMKVYNPDTGTYFDRYVKKARI